ncbi:MAG: peptidase, partial [Xanthomonadales bacterium]|nr:peptidase [Xanthomonadales bacterium]
SLGRESFARRTGAVFDPLSPAESAARLTLDVLLNRTRLERMNRASLADSSLPSASTVLRALVERTWQMDRENGARGAVQRIVASQVLNRLYPLAIDSRASSDLRAQALAELSELQRWLERVSGSREDKDWKQFLELARFDIRRYMARPGDFDPTPPPVAPPGSPIGGG